MSYIVKNCPSITTGRNDKDYICNTHQMGCGHCLDCTDCIIKQVIEKCNQAPILDADWVLKLFDIEEVRE